LRLILVPPAERPRARLLVHARLEEVEAQLLSLGQGAAALLERRPERHETLGEGLLLPSRLHLNALQTGALLGEPRRREPHFLDARLEARGLRAGVLQLLREIRAPLAE